MLQILWYSPRASQIVHFVRMPIGRSHVFSAQGTTGKIVWVKVVNELDAHMLCACRVQYYNIIELQFVINFFFFFIAGQMIIASFTLGRGMPTVYPQWEKSIHTQTLTEQNNQQQPLKSVDVAQGDVTMMSSHKFIICATVSLFIQILFHVSITLYSVITPS